MPVGPVLMQVNSVLDTVKTEVIIFISNQNKKKKKKFDSFNTKYFVFRRKGLPISLNEVNI